MRFVYLNTLSLCKRGQNKNTAIGVPKILISYSVKCHVYSRTTSLLMMVINLYSTHTQMHTYIHEYTHTYIYTEK